MLIDPKSGMIIDDPTLTATQVLDPGVAAGSGETVALDQTHSTAALAAPIVTAAGTGLIINATYDASITNLGTTSIAYLNITGAINAAIQYFQTAITTPITVTINFGFGQVGGTSLVPNALAASIQTYSAVNYSTLRMALANHATTAGLQTLVNNLPLTDPTTNPTTPTAWQLSTAEAKALNISSGNAFRPDGIVGLSSTLAFTYDPNNRAVFGQFDAIGVLEHEISEVLGRTSSLGTTFGTGVYTPWDLFRYASPGNRQLHAAPGYFSIDGGTTNLNPFDDPTQNSGDLGDWGAGVLNDASNAVIFSGAAYTVSATDLTVLNALGFTLAAACYAAGTRILTIRGDIAVEELVEGDLVSTRFGGLSPVKWVGQRRIDCARHPDPRQVWPVRVMAGAFGSHQPRRDLVLSPDHAVVVDGALIPIRLLINGGSIRQETGTRNVHYFHVELDHHDIVVAEGLDAESYLDTGNRGMFANAGGALTLHPGAEDGQRRREALSCLPFLDEPEAVLPIWHRLAERAEAIGHALPVAATVEDPALCLVMDGQRIAPVSRTNGRYSFVLPARASNARLVSHHAVPSDTKAWVGDRRRLGVMIRGIVLRRGSAHTAIALDSPDLANGWWRVETDSASMWRWTNGDAELPELDGPAILEVQVGDILAYPVANPEEFFPLALSAA